MNRLFIILFLFANLHGFAQLNLEIFDGSFEQALDLAKKQNKDIFLITRSESCPLFGKFKTIIENNDETIDFLNSELIVYEYDKDKTTKEEDKEMKKYYHSWRGFPQLYFIDSNEQLITDLIYPLQISQSQQLQIWKEYKDLENKWKKIKPLRKTKDITFEELDEYLAFRQMKYSSFDLIHIKKILNAYFDTIENEDYSSKSNWILYEKYITIYSNPELFDMVAQNKLAFQKENGDELISEYLLKNYENYIGWRKEEKVEKLSEKYPYNSVDEAKQALINYRRSKTIQSIIKPLE